MKPIFFLLLLAGCATPTREPQGREALVLQLDSSDAQARWWAVVKLADIADPRDFESLLVAGCRHENLRAPLSVRLRDWKDLRAVPFLAELLESADGTTRANAVISLGELPPCPRLKPDHLGTECQGDKILEKSDSVAPYVRWWKESGADAFKREVEWWKNFKRERGLP